MSSKIGLAISNGLRRANMAQGKLAKIIGVTPPTCEYVGFRKSNSIWGETLKNS